MPKYAFGYLFVLNVSAYVYRLASEELNIWAFQDIMGDWVTVQIRHGVEIARLL